MSHMVIYRGIDGKPGYQQAEDIHDAVTFVEQMRNEEGVEQARIFRLEEVTFEYRPYYRVELSTGSASEPVLAAAPPAMVGASAMAATPPVSEEASVSALDESFEVVETATATINVDDPDIEAVGPNGARRGLFGR